MEQDSLENISETYGIKNMMLQFTSTVKGREGDRIFINKDWIVSVYENAREEGGSLSTVIYGGPGTNWEVEESLSEVIAKINA